MITRVSLSKVTYITRDRTGSGTVPRWQFLQAFQPVTERKRMDADYRHLISFFIAS